MCYLVPQLLPSMFPLTNDMLVDKIVATLSARRVASIGLVLWGAPSQTYDNLAVALSVLRRLVLLHCVTCVPLPPQCASNTTAHNHHEPPPPANGTQDPYGSGVYRFMPQYIYTVLIVFFSIDFQKTQSTYCCANL